MRGFPAEGTLEFFLAGDQHGGISRTTRTQFARDLAAGDAFRDVDDLQNGKAAAVADVEGFAGNAVDLLEGADVGISDIEHMDVVANAGSVRRGVIRSKDIDVGQAASGCIKNTRYEMCFHAMIFAARTGS